MIHGGARIGDGVLIGPFSMVPEDFEITAGQHWAGSPVQRVAASEHEKMETRDDSIEGVEAGVSSIGYSRMESNGVAAPRAIEEVGVCFLQVLWLLFLVGIQVLCYFLSVWIELWPI